MLLMVVIVVGSWTAFMVVVVVVTMRLRTWRMTGMMCWRDRRAMMVLYGRGWRFTRHSLMMVIVAIGSSTSSWRTALRSNIIVFHTVDVLTRLRDFWIGHKDDIVILGDISRRWTGHINGRVFIEVDVFLFMSVGIEVMVIFEVFERWGASQASADISTDAVHLR